MRSQPTLNNKDAQHHEKMALGSMLLDNSLVKQAARSMSSAFFREPKHRFIFDAILKLHRGYSKINVVTVANVLAGTKQLTICGGAKYLAELTGYVQAKAKAHHDAAIRAGVKQAGGNVGDGGRITL